MKLTQSSNRNEIKSWLVAAGCSLLVGTTLSAQGVSEDSAPPAPPVYIKDHQLIVKFKKEKTAGEIDSVNKKLKTKSARVLSRRMNAHLVDVPAGETVESMIEKFKASGAVDYAEPDFEMSVSAMPNDPKFLDGTQWSLHNTGGQRSTSQPYVYGVADMDIDAPEAWDIQASAEGVIVAVIDTGINYNHQDLKNSMWKNSGESGLDANGKDKAKNGVDDDGNGYIDDVYGINAINGKGDPLDDHYHGTHCAGVIGASSNDGVGMAGIAPKVKLMGCKFLSATGSGYTSDALECIEYARKMGAHIMSNSWGGGGSSQALYDSIDAARKQGIIFVAAAGNNYSSVDLSPHYPASYIVDNVVSVGSIDRAGNISGFSNYGSGMVHLFAPGSDIYSCAISTDTALTNSSYRSVSGTSMATPHVSGTFALLKARYPNDTYNQLINRLQRSVDGDSRYMYKSQNKGRLNAASALLCQETRPVGDDSKEGIRLISKNGVQARASTAGATKEAGEADHAGVKGGHSVWFTWRAQANGVAKLYTHGSSFDTVMAVYSGNNLKVALYSNDDANGKKTSAVTFAVKKGEDYKIAVDGKNGEVGAVSIHADLPPPNDDFANRQLMTGSSVITKVSNWGSSAEVDEPTPFPSENPPLRSLWYTWKAPSSGTYVIDTNWGGYETKFDTVLAVYTGTQLNNLAMIAANDDIGRVKVSGVWTYDNQSRVTISAVAGTTYSIAIDGYGGGQGLTSLRIYPNGTTPPK